MRSMRAFAVLACACVLALAVYQSNAEAVNPGNSWFTKPGGINCPSLTNLPAAELKAVDGPLTGDFSELSLEVESATPVYFCGENLDQNGWDGGINAANAEASCPKRCSDSTECPKGSTYGVGVKRTGTGYCWSEAAADGGVLVKATFLR